MIDLVRRHSNWTPLCTVGKIGTILKTYTEPGLSSKVINWWSANDSSDLTCIFSCLHFLADNLHIAICRINLVPTLETDWINRWQQGYLYHQNIQGAEALAPQSKANSNHARVQARKKKRWWLGLAREKSPEPFHLETWWNLLTEGAPVSRACIRQSGAGDKTNKHAPETSTTLTANWLWLNISCHQGNRGNERKALFLCKEKNCCQKGTRK